MITTVMMVTTTMMMMTTTVTKMMMKSHTYCNHIMMTSHIEIVTEIITKLMTIIRKNYTEGVANWDHNKQCFFQSSE